MSDEETPKKDNRTLDAKTYEDRVKAVNVLSHPLASKKLTKRAYKLVKKSSKSQIRRGVKEVLKGIRKKSSIGGLALIAGDIYPLDVISHLPILLEEAGTPYLFVPSKQELGAAANTKRPTSIVWVQTPTTATDIDASRKELFDSLVEAANAFDPTKLTKSY